MMERNVVSLDTARKLKAAGFPQGETETFWWTEFYNQSSTTPETRFNQLVDEIELVEMEERRFLVDLEKYAAPTAQEIADQLQGEMYEMIPWPPGFQIKHSPEFLKVRMEYGYTLAEALAQLWLKLHEAKA